MNHHLNRNQLGRRLRRRHVIQQSALPRQINANKPTVIGSFLIVPALPSATFLLQHHPFSHAALVHTTCRASFLSTGTHLCLVFFLRPDSVLTMAPTMAMRRLLSTPAVSFPPTLRPRLSPATCALRPARPDSCANPPVQQQTANTRPHAGVSPGEKPVEGILFHSSSWYVFYLLSANLKLGSSEIDVIVGSQNIREPTSASPRGFTFRQHQVPSNSASNRAFLP